MSSPGHVISNPLDSPSLSVQKRDIIEYIRIRLGGSLVDVELGLEEYEMCIKQALIKYRQRAAKSVEESYAFLDLVKETQEYILPREIKTVRQIFRRGIGGVTSGATQFEPFSSGFLNTYMLVAGRVGGLTNYELFVDYQKLTMKMFGGNIDFTFNPATSKLTIIRKIPSDIETVALWVYNEKPDSALLADHMIFPWIQEFAYAMAKQILGEAREKFAQIAGPQGGSSLNGAALKAEAKVEMDKLLEDLTKYIDGSSPLYWVIG